MLTPLRAEVNELLAQTPVRRKPALRRSDDQRALLATDLPFAAEAAATADFIVSAGAAGWRITCAANGWLLLDKPVPAPAVIMPEVLTGECGCCISLLFRHPQDAPADVMIREVVRAEEAGEADFDRLCRSLHARLSAMLRLHQSLPGALTPYLIHAYKKFYNDGRK